MDKAATIVDKAKQLQNERGQLNHMWEEIAEVLAPERVGFVSNLTSEGSTNVKRESKIYDTTPLMAKRSLVNAIGGMLRPKSAAPGKWFDITPEDDTILDKDKAAKEWVEFAEDRLWKALYNPKAQFIQATGEVDDDLITFGTGAGFLGMRRDKKGFLFRSFHLAKTFIEMDYDNQPNSVYIIEWLTAKQAAAKWGRENIGKTAQKALVSSDKIQTNEKYEFIWCVKPRYELDPERIDNLNMPWMSIVIAAADEHIVLEEGFKYFPFFFPRWDTRSGEAYGRGPGVLALPDVLTLNQMGKTMLRGLHRAVAPPWLLPSDSMVNAPQMQPDGISYYDAKAIRNLGLSNPFIQMESRAQIPWGLNAQTAGREQLMALFFRNVLNLPVDSPQMTATEVIQRREEFVREIGAVFGRLESDYTGPIVEHAFNTMLDNGSFGTPDQIPESLQGANIEFRFASPVEKAKRQIEETTVMEGLQEVVALSEVWPEVKNRYNGDAIGKFIAKARDFPVGLTHDDAKVAEMGQQQQEAAAKEQQMQQMERGAAMAGSLPPEALAAAGGGEGEAA
tara:strand:- start:3864 stop:5552 length:1689 start_codon:yes stop_codon:yes gene_type:complete